MEAEYGAPRHRRTLNAPPRFKPEIDSTSVIGTSSWFFMPISQAVSTRNSSWPMYRSAFTSRLGMSSHAPCGR